MRLNTREWDSTFKRYMQLSKRDLPTALNAKAFFIARRAVLETPKAEIGRMSRKTSAILGKIINQRRGQRGEKGLYGLEMAKAVEILYAARRRSIAFLKSGWLPAIKLLEQAVEPKYRRNAPRSDRASKQYGQPKGSAKPARSASWRVHTIIENAASATRDKKDALHKYAAPALAAAFAHEVQSMKEYIERKMRDTAKSCGIKTN